MTALSRKTLQDDSKNVRLRMCQVADSCEYYNELYGSTKGE
jgi:hypothetical protein